MTKQLNTLQPLIDELHQNKKLHSEIAENYKNNAKSHTDYEQYFYNIGIENGFKQAIEMLAKFNFWNYASTNPPKFDKNREFPNCPPFACVVKYDNGAYNLDRCYYNFDTDEWGVGVCCQVVFWQEYSILPKEILEWEFR